VINFVSPVSQQTSTTTSQHSPADSQNERTAAVDSRKRPRLSVRVLGMALAGVLSIGALLWVAPPARSSTRSPR
jgi:hypothetical protein